MMSICLIKLTFGLILCVQYCAFICNANNQAETKLLLILFDGFRWDYVKDDMKGFDELKKNGVHADYLIPVFPTMSFPNYYSLVTGLYVESHGMVMNYMYDPKKDDYFMMLPFPNSTHAHWWEEAEPFWVTAIKNNRKAHLYLWPDGHINSHGVNISNKVPYRHHDSLKPFSSHLTNALQHLKNEDIDVVLMYCEYIDHVGHVSGPNSDKLKSAVQQVNEKIQILIQDLHTFKLSDKVNVVIVSDHGMTPTGHGYVTRISLDKYINVTLVHKILGEGAVIGVYPRSGYLENVYNDLKKGTEFNVWRSSEIPEKFHMKFNARTPHILIIAKKNYYITALENSTVQIPNLIARQTYEGYHGYDVDEVPDMRGIFFGIGPGFEKGAKITSIKIVDIYNILMHLLRLESFPNNGSWSSVYKLLISDNVKDGSSPTWYDGISGVLVCVGGIYIYSLIVIAHSWV